VKAIVVDDESTSAPMAADAVGTFDDVYRREQPELVRLAAAMAPEVYAVVHEVVFTAPDRASPVHAAIRRPIDPRAR
jgi:hypothetical protein